MKTRQVVIELLPGRIDLVVLEGDRRVASRRLPVAFEDDSAEWAKMVRRSGTTLEPIVAELGATRRHATVLYRSPTQTVDLSGFAVHSPGEAQEAALLACRDSLGYSAMSAVSDSFVIGRDAAGDARQIHVLTAAEREDVAEAIVQMVEGAGLRFRSALPLDAAVLGGLVRAELARKGKPRGTLYVGEHTSYFLVAGGGRLLFNRRIDLGLESLATSLTRPLSPPGRDEAIELGLDEAHRMLERFGIPKRDDVVSETRRLTGGQVMPLLQPVLQRFVVELRQSIRFGLDESQRRGLTLFVTGPGSALPGLADLIGHELDIETAGDDGYAGSCEWLEPSSVGELADALRDAAILGRLSVMPRELARRRRSGRLRRWALTGAAAAAVIILADGLRYHVRLMEARIQAERYASQLEDIAHLQATDERLRTVVEARSILDQRIHAEFGTRVNFRACMQEISRITPESVRFDSMRFERQKDRTIGTLTGCAFQLTTAPDANELEPFMDALRESPLFDGVVLGNVHVGTLGTGEGQRFEATFTVVPVPWERTAVTAAGGESAPAETPGGERTP